MRAVAADEFGAPDVLSLRDLADPPVGPDTVLVAVAAAGVNPVDWKVLQGGLAAAIPTHFPLVPGWDVAGTVAAVGPAVTEFEPGQRVVGYNRRDHVQHGTFAELTPAPVRCLAPAPDGADLVALAGLPLAGLTALQCLEAAHVGDGDVVLVHNGAGGVGSFAVQLAAARGARVVATAGPHNHDHVRALGGEPVPYGDAMAEAVRDVAGRVDAVVDLFGGGAVEASLPLVADAGRVVSVADPGVRTSGGVYVFVRPDAAQLADLAAMVGDGRLRVDVAETFPLERAADALRRNADGHVRGKVVVTVG